MRGRAGGSGPSASTHLCSPSSCLFWQKESVYPGGAEGQSLESEGVQDPECSPSAGLSPLHPARAPGWHHPTLQAGTRHSGSEASTCVPRGLGALRGLSLSHLTQASPVGQALGPVPALQQLPGQPIAPCGPCSRGPHRASCNKLWKQSERQMDLTGGHQEGLWEMM